MEPETISLSSSEAACIATTACLRVGASTQMTRSLVDATLSAAMYGNRMMGFPHFVDYLHGIRQGRIAADATPRFDRSLPAHIHADARGGIAQLGFDLAFDDLVNRTRTFGIAIFSQKNSYTAGELGYYARRLAAEGMLSIACANAHALMAPTPGGGRAFGTNPLAFGAPLERPSADLVIDQASSATAFVNIARIAERGGVLPVGWAIDENGFETTDPRRAMQGALLPFGGYKGANVALMVELLSAGLSGASWSTEAGNFQSGAASPNVGLTVVAICPSGEEPSFIERVTRRVDYLQRLGVHIPGRPEGRTQKLESTVEIERPVLDAINAVVAASHVSSMERP